MGAPVRLEDLYTAWSRNQWKSVYLFAGSEDFLIEEAVTKFLSHKLAADDQGLNRDRLDGETHSVTEILNACQTVPFLGTCRVVQVNNTSALSPADQKELAESLPHLSSNAYLLLIWNKDWRRDDLNKPLVDAVLQQGQVVIFWPFFPEHAQRWLIQRARHYQKTLAPEAASWMVQQEGESLRLLDQELCKAVCYSGGRPNIELDDVQAASGYEKASSPYEWIHSIRRKKGAQAVHILGRLLEEGEEPLRLLAIASGSLRDWLMAKNSKDSLPALAARFHLRRGEEVAFIQELERLSEDELMEGLSACVEADEAVKTGKDTPEMALTLLTLRLGRL